MRCDGCEFTYDLNQATSAGRDIAAGVAELGDALRNAAPVDRRPEPSTWSPLEYACHVRDVLFVQRERVLLARRAERPSLTPMGRDERVNHDGYADQAMGDVLRQLDDAALLFANVVDRLDPADWDRTVMYNYPERAERSLRWVAVHTVHEINHHRLDIEGQVR